MWISHFSYGLVYFLNEMVIRKDIAPSLKGLRCAISGSGNVSQFAAEKLQKFGALVMTLSDSSGTLYVITTSLSLSLFQLTIASLENAKYQENMMMIEI